MSATATREAVAETPPDTRGPTSPEPMAILITGWVSVGAAIGGTLLLQVLQALAGPRVTQECVAEGVERDFTGAGGVCNILEAFRSRAQTILLLFAIAAAIGAIAAGFWRYRHMPSKRMREQCIAGAVLGVQGLIVALALLWVRQAQLGTFVRVFFNIEVLEGYGAAFLQGARNTLLLAFAGEIGGIILGLVMAMLVLSKRRVVRAPARVYINFFRGTPLVWQLLVFYFGLALGLNLDVGAFQVAIIVFSLNTGAYAAEVFRAGIQSIEKGQMDAARSLGMSYMQAMRYSIVPQAVRRVIPPLMNEFVILIKDTALVIVLGLLASEYDLLSVAREGYSATFNSTFFVAAAVGYLAVTLPLIRLVNWVESRLRSGLTGIVGQ
ncbi:MAG: amino acid ABC transporter permease [Actinomycetota bacterium]|nr:amino acid ABC transporter permease [Actinomycetota bacterium]